MKTLPSVFVLAAALGSTALVVQAGPPPDYVNRIEQTRKQHAANAKSPAPAACPSCETALIRRPEFRGPPNRPQITSAVVGVTHTCTDCEGKLIVRGREVRDTMKHGSRCGTCCSPRAIAQS